VITQAVQSETGIKIIGICDTPTELFGEVAAELQLEPGECAFDYFGLNHLGWLREVRHRGEPVLEQIWADPRKLSALYRAPLFEASFLVKLRLLPTEYLYYYYRPEYATANIRRSGKSRGRVISELNFQLFEELSRPGGDAVEAYDRYLRMRDASYMQIESGTEPRPIRKGWAEMAGYDKIALAVVRAIHLNSGDVIPLNVPNSGNFEFLEADDVVEVPCLVNCNGASSLNVGQIPDTVRELIREVKEYERLTIEAAKVRTLESLRRALGSNPLVPDDETAEELLLELEIL
jgi:6-phospho-beta-glucosidase